VVIIQSEVSGQGAPENQGITCKDPGDAGLRETGGAAQDIGRCGGEGGVQGGCGVRANVNTCHTFRDIGRKAGGIHGGCASREEENAGGVDEGQVLKAQINQATLTPGYIEIDGGQEVTHRKRRRFQGHLSQGILASHEEMYLNSEICSHFIQKVIHNL
jgi:hypothetical protein